MSVRVLSMRDRLLPGETEVNTTSRARTAWEGELSPFLIGPCPLYGGYCSKNMENAWQFSKLYAKHADAQGNPTRVYWEWATQGWGDGRAHRYPMGRGAIPLCSLWGSERLGYIDARKQIYVPLYAEAVQKTFGWRRLKELCDSGARIALRDFDGYDHQAAHKSLRDVLNDPQKKMGHAFVLAMLLLEDAALDQCAMRAP